MATNYIYRRTDTLVPKQEAILGFDREHTFCCVESTTKTGKSYAAEVWEVGRCFSENPAYGKLWISPSQAQATKMMKRLVDGLRTSALPRNAYKVNKSNSSIEFTNGATIIFKSGDIEGFVLGEDNDTVVLDEAALIKEGLWENIVSTISAVDGKVLMLSNLNGRSNWFYKLCRKIEDNPEEMEGYVFHRLTYKDSLKYNFYDEKFMETVKRGISEARFNELYMGVVSETGQNPFGHQNIQNCIIDKKKIEDRNVVCFGIDLAASSDFTCCVGLNKLGQVVILEHFQAEEDSRWIGIERRLKTIVSNVPAICDSTSMGGQAVLDHMIEAGVTQLQGYNFSNASKGAIVEGLAVAIQNKEVTFPDSWMVRELENFESEFTKTGKIRYEGRRSHDDGVDALCLAWSIWKENSGGKTFDLVWSF